MNESIQKKLIIVGRVQGVFFRLETQKEARRLGISGYVKNLPDGSVQAVIQGDAQTVGEMIKWCYQGPPASKVDHIDLSDIEPLDDFSDRFDVRY